MGYRYIGSKARIANEIIEYIKKTANFESEGFFIDAFSGTGVVAENAAKIGWPVHINDMMINAIIMSEARLLSLIEVPFNYFGGYEEVINILNNVTPLEGFIWREYSPASRRFQQNERRYFTEENAKKIDAISTTVIQWKKEKVISHKEFVLLMSDLIQAVNNVANIAGTYGCFLSKWTAQAKESLLLRTSVLKKSQSLYKVSNCDVFDLESNPADILYLDPPYTKRQYASYYHILETIVCGDHPEVTGVSGLRPWKDKASVFCYKTKALNALSELILKQKANRIILSYSNEGHIQLEELVERLSPYGEVLIVELKTIGRYRPNRTAVKNNSEVNEFLVDFRRK